MKTISEKSNQVSPEKKTHGFFQIPRDIFNLHYFWEKPFTKDRALNYLISHAVFKTNTIEIKRQNCTIKIKLNRNEVFTSRHKLRKHWGRSLGWIDRFLSKLERKKLIKTSVVETALKTKKRVYTSIPLKFRKTGLYRNEKTRLLGIRVKLLFLDDLDEERKQKQVYKILEK